MELKRREGEPISAFLYRFSKKIQQRGILREAKKRKYKIYNPYYPIILVFKCWYDSFIKF